MKSRLGISISISRASARGDTPRPDAHEPSRRISGVRAVVPVEFLLCESYRDFFRSTGNPPPKWVGGVSAVISEPVSAPTSTMLPSLILFRLGSAAHRRQPAPLQQHRLEPLQRRPSKPINHDRHPRISVDAPASSTPRRRRLRTWTHSAFAPRPHSLGASELVADSRVHQPPRTVSLAARLSVRRSRPNPRAPPRQVRYAGRRASRFALVSERGFIFINTI